ncbi:MAG: hypothetical protein ACM3XN_03195 [Chloroflexota bacterium]
MLNRRLVAATLAVLLAFSSGCSLLGGQQKQPSPTKDDMREMVRSEIRSPEMKQTIQDSVATDQLQPMITKVLDGEEGKKAVQKAVAETITKPEMQAQLTAEIQKALQSPQGQQLLTGIIQNVITEIIRKGAAQSGGGQQGAQQGGGGGSSPGGGR